jgi:hypothetical protein
MSLAIAYTPELADPILANVAGGAVVIAFPGEEKSLVLNPGNNFNIDQELWQRAQELSSVREMLEQRLVEEIDLSAEKVDETPAAAVVSIAKTEQRAALRLIHHSRDVAQLSAWHDADERMAIRNACKRRIAEIEDGNG